MADQGPHVSVFHFTSRISSAKIRKYKLATERGMSARHVSAPTVGNPEPAPSGQQATFFVQQSGSSATEPPTKKQRLKLNVRQPGDGVESASMGRPVQPPSMRIRYSENMTVDSNNKLSIQTFPDIEEPLVAPNELPSMPSARTTHIPPRAASPKPRSAKHQYGANFASYYIASGDESEVPSIKSSVPKIASPKHSSSAAQRPPALPPSELRPAQTSYIKSQAPVNPPQGHIPAPTMLPQRPSVDLIDDIQRSPQYRAADTVQVMIKKLDVLSDALTDFGGGPGSSQPPMGLPSKPLNASSSKQPDGPRHTDSSASASDAQHAPRRKAPHSKQRDTAVDSLLAMFGDVDSEEDVSVDSPGPTIPQPAGRSLDYTLDTMATPDSPLSHGIQFIQNALKSWAKQRLNVQYAQHYHMMMQQAQAQQTQPPKRGPGRPRKFDSYDDQRAQAQLPPICVKMLLSSTPEGAAIAAFQQVLESGCLRVNSCIPTELAQSLSKLYMQIDRLINQGAAETPPWQCMSYGAQIKAHKWLVERWKEQQAKAHEEMAKQQHLAQQQVMQQMGVSPQQPRRSTMAPEQVQQMSTIEPEPKRNVQYAVKPPHSSPHSTASATARQPAYNAVAPNNAARPHDIASLKASSSTSPRVPVTTNGTAVPPQKAEVGGKLQNDMSERAKLYMPNLLSRSGQSMKFSFMPQNEQAIKVFGAQAFSNAAPATAKNASRDPSLRSPPTLPLSSHADSAKISSSDAAARFRGPLDTKATSNGPVNGNIAGTMKAAPTSAISITDTSKTIRPGVQGFTAVNLVSHQDSSRSAAPSKVIVPTDTAQGAKHRREAQPLSASLKRTDREQSSASTIENDDIDEDGPRADHGHAMDID